MLKEFFTSLAVTGLDFPKVLCTILVTVVVVVFVITVVVPILLVLRFLEIFDTACWHVPPSPMKFKASSLVANFLYLAPLKPSTCFLQSFL